MSGHQNALPYKIGVESRSKHFSLGDLSQMCAAIQSGILRDVAPAWGVAATVAPFPAGQIPPGYWPVSIQDGIDAPGAAGYHDDSHRVPYALIDATAGDVSLSVDHEIKEMVCDPWGSRTWVYHAENGRRIHVLIEVCDPPEQVSQMIDGVEVSDFVLPVYYRHHKKEPVQRTHHNTPLSKVAGIGLGLAPGGYVSWWDEHDAAWYQATWFGGPQPALRRLGHLETRHGADSPRSLIDQMTREFRAEVYG